MTPGARIGRFAPSPTGDLHVGNLRTALASWLDARAGGGAWLVRFEDLDQAVASRGSGERQLDQLAALGMQPDAAPIWQSDHLERYAAAVADLVDTGRTYPCYCSRREIREAIAASVSAPNGLSDPGTNLYPGTCAGLGRAERDRRAAHRPPALRLRAERSPVTFDDAHLGSQTWDVDDFVVQRNDGVPAYNLVVVVDDHETEINSVVRADDLLASTARQLLVGEALGLPRPRYAHVPLIVNAQGERLSKRDRSITLDDLAAEGVGSRAVLERLLVSMHMPAMREHLDVPGRRFEPSDLIARWEPVDVTRWQNVWGISVDGGLDRGLA